MRCALLVFLQLAAAHAEPWQIPQVTTPPPWAPYYVAPGPSPAQIAALEEAGRHKRRVGAILMSSGGAIALAGTAMIIAGAIDENHHCHARYWDGEWGHDGCQTSSLAVAGTGTALLGMAAIIPGIVVYVSGGSQVSEARRLRRCYFTPLSLRPTVSRSSAGVELVLSH